MARHPMYQNASLLRELRMISQHLSRALGGSTPGPRLRVRVPQPWVPLCVRCCTRKRSGMTKIEPMPAVTISGGNALCEAHL